MKIKKIMADFMMGNMTPEEKKTMMDQMMNQFFSDMKPEEKQKMMGDMMDKFMGTMSAEEKQSMMQSMMPKMMGSMMGGGSGSPMMNMMSMMMGGKGPMNMMGDQTSTEGQNEMPWDMCKKMMSSMSKTSELATFATPEVRQLFEEWSTQIEEEIMTYIRESKTNETEKIAEHFKLSRESVTYFLTRLAKKGKINLKAQKVD
jgi:hypothetical protein